MMWFYVVLCDHNIANMNELVLFVLQAMSLAHKSIHASSAIIHALVTD